MSWFRRIDPYRGWAASISAFWLGLLVLVMAPTGSWLVTVGEAMICGGIVAQSLFRFRRYRYYGHSNRLVWWAVPWARRHASDLRAWSRDPEWEQRRDREDRDLSSRR